MNLLMVCLGNICRSPLAEGILQSKLQKAGLEFFVDSAGMLSYHAGEPPDHRSIDIARRKNIDITGQRARKFSISDFDAFDLIFAMDEAVRDEIVLLTKNKNQKDKVHLFLEFAGYEIGSNVPDPYYGGKTDFENVFVMINLASEKIVEKFISGIY